MPSLIECALCLDELSEPRQLPCSHTYCTKCLQLLHTQEGGLQGGTAATLNCPECRARIKVGKLVPEKGVTEFPINRYVIEIIRRENEKKCPGKEPENGNTSAAHQQCANHSQPMTLFCDEVQCQKQICALCVVAQHKTHDVIPHSEKADNVIAELEQMRENNERLNSDYDTYLTEVKNAIKEIHETKDKSLQAVDETKDMIINTVTEMANKYRKEIVQRNDKQLVQLKYSIDDITGRMESLDTCCSLIGQFLAGNSPQEILANSHAIIQGCIEATKFTTSQLVLPCNVEMVSFTPKEGVDFVRDVFGKLNNIIIKLPNIEEFHAEINVKAEAGAAGVMSAVSDVNKCMSDMSIGTYEENLEAVLGACAEPFIENEEAENMNDDDDLVWERNKAVGEVTQAVKASTKANCSVEAKKAVTAHAKDSFAAIQEPLAYNMSASSAKGISVQGKPTVAKHVGSWQGNGIHICVGNANSLCISGKDGEKNQVKAFDMVGNGRLLFATNQGIHAPFSVSIGDRDYLILTTGKDLQLRDGATGNYLDSLDFAGFEPGWTICQSGSETILVSNWSHSFSTINEYQIKDGKLKPPRKHIKIPLSIIRGMTMVTSGDRNLIVATSLHESAILAIDYETGQEAWKIRQENFEGARVGPFGITSDGTGHMFVSDCTNKRILVVSPSGKILQRIVGNATGCLHLVYIHGKRSLAVTDVNHMVHLYEIQYDIA